MGYSKNYGPSPITALIPLFFDCQYQAAPVFESLDELGRRMRRQCEERLMEEREEIRRGREKRRVMAQFFDAGFEEEDAENGVVLYRLFKHGEPGLLAREKVRRVLAGERELD